MRATMSVVFLGCVLLFNVSFSVASEQNLGGKSYGKMFSYFVAASSKKGDVLHIKRGMAVIITKVENRCILATAKHLVQGASTVRVMPLGDSSDNSKTIKAEVVYLDSSRDVAFLSFITNDNCMTPRVVLDENILIGKSVGALKYDVRDGYQTARGQIAGFMKLSSPNSEFMVAKMSTEEGFSGGGVFDEAGSLVGLVSGRDNGKNINIAYLISGPRIMEALIKSKVTKRS